MLDDIKIEAVLFLDIETVPMVPSFSELPEKYKVFWDKKSAFFRKSDESADDVFQRAGIYAEFGKIICISVGAIYNKEGGRWIKLKSFFHDDEKIVLQGFIDLLGQYKIEPLLCAHNGKEFDFPYISRRILINRLKLPSILNVAGRKPWEVRFIDTLELWKFGDFKNYTSLNLLASLFDIPTPKDDIDGSMVADVYWKEKNLKRIALYCQKDVLTVAQLFLSYRGEDLIRSANVDFSDY
jgi:3'-5' exonuclease